MQYKDEFYLIDTLEKAYMLGLLQADGAMLINNRAQSVCTKLKLKAEDKYLLDSIHKKWSFFTEPKLEVHKSGKKSYYIYYLNGEISRAKLTNKIGDKTEEIVENEIQNISNEEDIDMSLIGFPDDYLEILENNIC